MTETVSSLLAASGLPRGESLSLLAFACGRGRAWIAAHLEDEPEPQASAAAGELYARRRAGEPLAYLTGEREFFGLSLRVTPAVLIPRPESELLVERALAGIGERRGARVLDLGTGSGALAIALATQRGDLQVWACDRSPDALALAAENARRHGVGIRLMRSDWFCALGPERFDAIVCNPPYVASGDAHLRQGDLRFEPREALDGGPDGLACIRAVVGAARDHLARGGRLLFEHGWDQQAACMELMRAAGFRDVAGSRDLAGHPRVCEGRI